MGQSEVASDEPAAPAAPRYIYKIPPGLDRDFGSRLWIAIQIRGRFVNSVLYNYNIPPVLDRDYGSRSK
jgi:hypothetical protein